LTFDGSGSSLASGRVPGRRLELTDRLVEMLGIDAGVVAAAGRTAGRSSPARVSSAHLNGEEHRHDDVVETAHGPPAPPS
jgi:hypothetical protein